MRAKDDSKGIGSFRDPERYENFLARNAGVNAKEVLRKLELTEKALHDQT
ncbi:MAG: hypothetical protein KAW09_10750 [Thermoplasmata archaeon]|nr:hypothetical protein [Thermoplasmata archaeon]MCK4455174.1 hypothetical protein [Thermoplasmata archaeon]